MLVQRLTRKGSVTVEVAIFLPIFFLAVLTVAFSMRWILYELQVTSLVMDEAQRVAITAYPKEEDQTNIGKSFLLNYRITNRSTDETSLNGHCYVSDYNTDIQKEGFTDLIQLGVSYSKNIPFPFLIDRASQGETRLIFRGFVGRNEIDASHSSDSPEEDLVVWVFPVAGERYHVENCGFIRVWPRQVTLSIGLRRDYSPCKHCHPEELGDGNYVYVFPNQGSSYHRGNCFVVDRYVVAMMKSAAEERGYTPCKSCIGKGKK